MEELLGKRNVIHVDELDKMATVSFGAYPHLEKLDQLLEENSRYGQHCRRNLAVF